MNREGTIVVKSFNLVSAAALSVVAFSVGSAAASTVNVVDSFVETGTVFESASGSTTNSSIDYWRFTVSTAGTVTIDALSYGVLDGDGYGGVSRLDPFLRLFAFDASGDQGLLGTQVGANDDSSTSSGSDGSISSLDSYLSVGLAAGDYVLAISDYYLSEGEARSGTNQTSFDGTFGDYQLTFSGIEVAPVPLPAALPLLLAGIGGLGFAARRRKSS